MSTRAKSRMSMSFHPADLTTTILEEGDSMDSTSQQLENGTDYDNQGQQYHQQAELIAKLRQRVDDLEANADTGVPLEEHQRVQQEWQTSEDLLRGSQRDNEQKHDTIEQYKVYVKELERIIDETLGPNWKVDHQIKPPLSQSTCFSASTPLPKPSLSALRRSVSVLPSAKRSSKIASRHLSASTFGALSTHGPSMFENKDVMEMDDTPTGAMRKLMGSSSRPHFATKMTERAVSGPRPSTLNTQINSPSKPTADLSIIPVNPPPTHIPSTTVPQLDAEQISSLLQMLALNAGANNNTKVPDDTVLVQTMERIDKAEKEANAREARLRLMLEETRAGST